MFQPVRKITAGEVATVDFPMLSRTKQSLDQDTTWFQNSRESIAERRKKVQAFATECRRFASTFRHTSGVVRHSSSGDTVTFDESDVAIVFSWVDAATREMKTLSSLEAEYVDVETQEQLQALPQYSVMAGRAPQVRLGENYSQRMPSSLSYEEAPSVDWGKFIYIEPPLFVQRNAAVAENSAEMRERAVDFIAVHVSSIDSDVLKSQVIDEFVTGVERSRRQHLATAPVSQQTQSKNAGLDFSDKSISDCALFL